jgi:RNA polymerase sigma-70 factor (ECF subfamily)
VDGETVTHEVFYRLLTDPKMRESFRGGSLGAWLVQVATRAAIDDLRRRRREISADESSRSAPEKDDALEAKLTIARFRDERLPPELAPVFEARFLRQLSQRDAAREIGLPRSTLAYQEQKVRELLRAFLLDDKKDEPR